jgi:Uma2 family endonuclease
MVHMATRPRQLRADDLPTIPVPDEHSGFELVRGELVPIMPAGSIHGRVFGTLWARLRDYETATKLGMALTDTWTRIPLPDDPEQVRAPDVAFIRREKYRHLTGELPTIFPFLPDLAVEVFSPTNERKSKDFDQRIRDYLDAGVALVWVIYPTAKYATVFHPDGSARFLRETEWLEGEDVLPGFRIALAELFAQTEWPG